MWIKINKHRAVNLDTNVTLDVEQGSELVYNTTYLFKKIPFSQEMDWEKTDEWYLTLNSKGRSTTIRQGSEEDCLILFNKILMLQENTLDFSNKV
jgi:hypothetical protein